MSNAEAGAPRPASPGIGRAPWRRRHALVGCAARLARLVLALVPALLLSSGCRIRDSVAAEPPPTRVLAIVDGQPITAADLHGEILERYWGKQALVALIRKRLFLAEAARRGVTVNDADLEARVEEELGDLMGDTPGSREYFREDLQLRGLELADVRRSLGRELADRLLIEGLVQAGRTITESDIQRRFAATYEQTRVRVRHIAFPFEVAGRPSDARVRETRERAEEASRRLENGAAFADVARELSGNRETAARGGELGWIRRETLAPELGDVIFSLPPGRVSEPVREQDYGFHLIRVDERSDAQPLTAVREELRRQLEEAPASSLEVLRLEERLRQQSRITYFWEELEGAPDAPPTTRAGGTRGNERGGAGDRAPEGR